MRKASTNGNQRRQDKILEASIIILALWQLRKTWRLLLLTGLGITTAVVLVCAVPLYSHVATTIGLRQILTNPDSNNTLIVSSLSQQISPQAVQGATQDIETSVRTDLGPYLSTSSEFSLDMQGPLSRTSIPPSDTDQIELIGSAMKQAISHVELAQGRLPLAKSSTIEIALTPQEASSMHVKVGSTLTTSVFYGNTSQGAIQRNLMLTLVGLFVPHSNDSFWHQQDFQNTPLITRAGNFTLYRALVSNETVLSVLARVAADPTFPGPANRAIPGPVLQNEFRLYWYYHIDPSFVDVDNLDDAVNKLQTVLTRITPLANSFTYGAYVEQTTSSSYAPTVLIDYSRRLTVANIPIMSLTLLVVGLILFFVSLMTDMLVEYHTGELAVLRSRGASSQQLFGSLLIQGIGLGVAAFLLGLPLALVVVFLLTQKTLLPSDDSAFSLITQHLWGTLQAESFSAFCVVGAAILAMVVSLLRVARMDMLALRRETTRSTHRPLWTRLYLDVVAALIASLGFLYSLYLTSPNVLDMHTRLLVLSPLTLLSSVFFLLGCVLLLLRFFPLLLQIISWLAEQFQSTTLTLAVTQMARTPRHVFRKALLLSLSLAFALFTLVFTASQTQRVTDVAAYQVGADFSGMLPIHTPSSSLQSQSEAYRHIPGVISATVGYTNTTSTEAGGSSIALSLLAVDAATYAQTTIWTHQNSEQSLPQLMQQLAQQRRSATENGGVPAIVDKATWQVLHLKRGIAFSISDYSTSIPIVPIAEVEHIPTVNDSPEATSNYFSSAGGMLVDYQTYADVFTSVARQDPSSYTTDPTTYQTIFVGPTLQLTRVWLRTHDDINALTSVRRALRQGNLQLDSVADRRVLVEVLRNDPLYRGLLGVLILGVLAALMLALVEDVTTSWLGARGQLLNVAVLRALGTAPWQIARMLLWEQGIVYSIALGLGVGFGILFSALALPALILTSVNVSQVPDTGASRDLFTLQSVPPVQITIPNTLLLGLCMVVVLYMIVSAIMTRLVSRSSVSQVLRLNED